MGKKKARGQHAQRAQRAPADEPTGSLDVVHALLDAAGGDLSQPSPDDEDVSGLDELELKARTKRILHENGPLAARKLARIAKLGDDKDAGPAAQGILDRIGFSKGEIEPARADRSLLDTKALIGALIGVGRVLGLRESEFESLQQSSTSEEVPFEVKTKKSPETAPKRLLPANVRGEPAGPVHGKRVRATGSAKNGPKA